MSIAASETTPRQAGARARAAISAELDALAALEEAGVARQFALTQRGTRITVSWVGLPTAEEMALMLAPHETRHGQLIELVLERRAVWSCGQSHEDEFTAWTCHEGEGYVRSLDRECCGGWESDAAIDVSVLQELISRGEDFTSSCRPGSFALCPWCAGSGSQREWQSLRIEECGACEGARVFDVSEASGRLGWEEARARVPGLLAAVERHRR